ncbi:hypothetical protein LTR53_003377 [Teratosphaeriaceae sp. CCFEE 6253]|nr:hypothetical protein LTR53_003377 [Teratosphaeriaceae sp. CCFEE 6253]
MLPDYYVSELARSRILREIASRAQKAASDVTLAWKHGSPIPRETALRVEAIMHRLQRSCESHTAPSTLPSSATSAPEQEGFLVVSVTDIITMTRALYPQRRPASLALEHYQMPSELQSSASSISGFSLFAGPSVPEFTTPTWLPHLVEVPGKAGTTAIVSTTPTTPSRATHVDCPEPDPDLLREACDAVESAAGPSGPGLDSWAVLDVAPGPESPLVMQRALAKSQPHRIASAATGHGPRQGAACLTLLETLLLDAEEGSADWPSTSHAHGLLETYLWFTDVLERAYRSAEESGAFVEAHSLFQQLRLFRDMFADGVSVGPLRAFLQDMEVQAHAEKAVDERSLDACTNWTGHATQALEGYGHPLTQVRTTMRRMRDKMWFIADVRTSGAYDQARSVANALRAMEKPRRSTQWHNGPSLRHLNSAKVPAHSFHPSTEAQVVDLLSASPAHGGPSKLSDDQARATISWLEHNNIEILCPAEERLHRLCMEVRKCVDELTAADSSLLTSSALFAREAPQAARQPSVPAPRATTGWLNHMQLYDKVGSGSNVVSNGLQGLSSASSREHMESRSPTLTHRSSAPLWSPVATEARSPSSATSIGSYQKQTKQRIVAKQDFATHHDTTEGFREAIIGLLLSDLTSILFSDGSETDRAFWTGLGGELTETHLNRLHGGFANFHLSPDDIAGDHAHGFDFTAAFRRMLESFAASSNPALKLSVLHNIDQLLPLHFTEQSGTSRADASIAGFRRLFCDSKLRPTAIFRDLQYIAALMPPTTLENTPAGKAFCNAAVAISGLRRELCTLMVETADSIIAYQTSNRGHGRTSSTAQQQRDSATFAIPHRTSPPAEDIARYRMEDAATLLQITAKEGDPVAQRELATLYLTHPDLMPHILAPFVRPRDVFREELDSKWRKNQDLHRCDPATMCVAHHWMSLSCKGGDALAKEFLKQREEMERLP